MLFKKGIRLFFGVICWCYGLLVYLEMFLWLCWVGVIVIWCLIFLLYGYWVVLNCFGVFYDVV